MGVLKKGKRRIVVDAQEYYWYVEEDYEVAGLGTMISLTVVSDDKRFLVRYPVNQQQTSGRSNLLIVLGKVFGGDGNWGSNWQRVESPKWEVEGAITPCSVEGLIRWSLKRKEVVFLDSQGGRVSG